MSLTRPASRALVACFVCLVAVLGSATDALAQRDAVIAGKVFDQQGNPVANASVLIISPDRGDRRELRTNAEGAFMGRGFRVDVYVIQVTAEGFGGIEEQIKANLGMNDVDVILPLAQPDVDYSGLNDLYDRGFKAYDREDWAAAEATIIELLAGMGDLASDEAAVMRKSALEILARSHMEQGHEEQAIATFQQLAAVDPDSLAANSWLGDLFTRRQEFETALPYLKRAAELALEDPAIQYNAGAIMLQVGEVEGGIAAMERAIALRPDFPVALKNLGYAYLRTQEYAKSIDALTRYLEASPDAADKADVEGMIEALKAQIQQ